MRKSVLLFATMFLAPLCPAQVHQRVVLDEISIGGIGHGFNIDRGVQLTEKSESMFWSIPTPNSLVRVGARGGEILFTFSKDLVLPGNRVISSGTPDLREFNRNGDVAFLTETRLKNGGDATDRDALYLFLRKKLYKVALEGEPAPGGGIFSTLLGFKFSDNGIIAFRATTIGGGGTGIYRAQVTSDKIVVSKVAVVGDSSPDGGRFKSFEDTRYLRVNNQGAILFGAETTENSSRLFHHLSEKISLAVPEGTKEPNLSEYWLNNSGNILIGDSIFNDVSIGRPNEPRTFLMKAVESGPIGTAWRDHDISAVTNILSDSTFVFTGNERGGVFGSSFNESAPGIFLWTAGNIKKIALTSDTPPGGGFYDEFEVLGAGGGWVYFHASLTGGEAILRGDGTKVERVISTGDFLEGKLVDSLFNARWDGAAVNGKGQILYPVGVQSSGGLSSDALYLWPTEPKPAIQVQQPKGNDLVNRKANLSFGKAKVGTTGRTLTFHINNTGTASLSSLTVLLTGRHSKDFTLSAPKKTVLGPRASISFKVTFRPTGKNNRNAVIQILSNDKSNNPFNISINGNGTLAR